MGVIKGCPIPLRSPDGGVRFWTESPVGAFERYLQDMREFLTLVIDQTSQLSREERMEFIADMIAIFFKAPLLMEPIRGLMLSPFKAYVTWRILITSPQAKIDLSKGLDEVMKALPEKSTPSLQRAMELLEAEATRAELILTEIPADSRPGYNCSSLIIHLLSVSSIAWAIGVQMGLNRFELGVLRLASILHDIGKPLAPKIHAKKSSEIAKELLRGLISEEDLEAVVMVIKSHHRPSEVFERSLRIIISAIKDADRISSAIDRVDEVVRKVAVPELAKLLNLDEKEAFEVLYRSTGPKVWELWENVPIEKIEELTAKCAKELSQPLPLKEQPEAEGPLIGLEVSMMLLDVAGIQKFVMEAEKLSIVSASSYLIDLAVMFNAIRFLQLSMEKELNIWYPVEGFLYSAGGNIIAVIPRDKSEFVQNQLKKAFFNGLGRFGGLKVRTAVTDLTVDYRVVYRELEHKIAVQKALVEDEERVLLTGLEKKCDFCGSRPATREYPIREEMMEICDVCDQRFSFFSYKGHMKEKWSKARPRAGGPTIKELFGVEWDEELYEKKDTSIKLRDRIMEIIAGHSPQEFSKGEPEPILNLAILKVDGNLIGAFMAKSFSLSDALEKSARIDLALKKAFRKAIDCLIGSIRVEDALREASRLLLGVQYMGGDDSLLFAPSWASIPFATALVIEFSREMGHYFDPADCRSYGATLSVGLVVASPRENIWMLLDAASELLKKAKEKGRDPRYDGALAFDVVERGALSGSTVKSRFRALKDSKLTVQPWTFYLREIPERINCDPLRSLRTIQVQQMSTTEKNAVKLLELAFATRLSGPSDKELERFYEELFYSAYSTFSIERSRSSGLGGSVSQLEKSSRIKFMRDAIRDIRSAPDLFEVEPKQEGFMDLIKLKVARELSREDNKAKRAILDELLGIALEWGPLTPLEDLYKLCKIVAGGAR